MRILIFVLCLLATPALAIMNPDERLQNPKLEARAVELTRTLRCVVCQNESIDESSADIARNLRIIVRKQILAGQTDAQVHQYLRERYGDYIMLEPPVAPRTYPLWLAPFIVLGIGCALMARSFKRRRRRA